MSLKQAIKKASVTEIRKISKELPIADIADKLEKLTSEEIVTYFRLLKTEMQSEIFSHLEPEYQEHLVKLFTNKQMKEIVGALYASDIADLIEDLPEELAISILDATDAETKISVQKILKYEEDQTGSIMNVDIILLKRTQTISSAIKTIKETKETSKLAHYFFVIDSKKKLSGYIALEDLLFGNKTTKLSTITRASPHVVTTTDKEEAALEFANYDMSVLPVVNTSKQVVGMITSDDVIDIVTDEATEDIKKMAGIGHIDDTPYSKKSTLSIFKSRSLWLMLLMLSATLSQIVLDSFQGFSNDLLIPTITTAIVAILPVISGAAGNAGSQSSTTIIRALAIGDIVTKDYLKVIWKEFKVSVLIGLLLGIANFIRLILYYAAKQDLNIDYLFLSLAASIALFAVIILAKLVGGTLPLLARKMKLDPTVMAAPLLTTLIDALSTMIFFGISIGIMVLIL